MRKTFFVLCIACLTASMACTAWAEDLVLPGTFLYVGNKATLAVPSNYSFVRTDWTIGDDTILKKDNSNSSSCTVTPLKAGNTTLMLGIDDNRIDEAISVIESVCKSRKQISTASSTMLGGMTHGEYTSFPIEVTVGGATLFVLTVDQFLKV